MLWAPHPDDETIAGGLLLQEALRAGGTVRVVFLTDGDNNPWPQRLLERRWAVGPEDRARWGRRRRAEARRAASLLGFGPGETRFLSYPDQGLTDLLLSGDEGLTGALQGEFLAWHPTVLVTPSLADLHPDHSATAMLARLVTGTSRLGDRSPIHFEYLVHGAGGSPSAVRVADPTLRASKRRALLCHRSQVLLWLRTVLPFPVRPERFFRVGSGLMFREDSAEFPLSPRPGAFGPIHVVLLELSGDGAAASRRVRLPRSGQCHLSTRNGTTWEVRRTRRAIALRRIADPRNDLLATFVKVERRFGFFDEAGWRALGPPTPSRRAWKSVSCTAPPELKPRDESGDVGTGPVLSPPPHDSPRPSSWNMRDSLTNR